MPSPLDKASMLTKFIFMERETVALLKAAQLVLDGEIYADEPETLEDLKRAVRVGNEMLLGTIEGRKKRINRRRQQALLEPMSATA